MLCLVDLHVANDEMMTMLLQLLAGVEVVVDEQEEVMVVDFHCQEIQMCLA
jgi:hypothetical protein